jgi:hypothetical protein
MTKSDKFGIIDLDDLNESNISPRRSNTAFANDRKPNLNLNRKKFVATNELEHQSFYEDPNFGISNIKIDSQYSSELFDATGAHASLQSNKVMNNKS